MLKYLHDYYKNMDDRKQQFLPLLKEKQAEIESLKQDLDENKVSQWKNEVLMILDNLMSSPDSRYYKEFDRLSFRSGVYSMGDPEGNDQRDRERREEDLNTAFSIISAILFGIEKGLV